ncbi:hypothetical protein NX029_26440 [Cytobacillus firmus]|nr:hypothetical protein [Cytobacillus firmus]
MKAGDIIFVRGNSLISKFVRFFDKGAFSHVVIAVSETEVLEAQYFTKSRITPFYFDDFEIVDLQLSQEEQMHVKNLSPSLTGKWYDYWQIISIMLKANVNNPNHYICSEIIAIILSSLGKYEYRQIKDVTPNQLYKLLKENEK